MSTGSPSSYFSLLGLDEDASQDELEARYQELADYLASSAIPPSLRDWAREQATLVDEAYAVLADPERRAAARLNQARAAAKATPTGSLERPISGTDRSARARLDSARRPSAGRPEQPEGIAAALLSGLRSQPFLLGGFIVLVVIGAVLLGRYGLPDGDGSEAAPAAEQTGALELLDVERITELLAAVEEDPNNPEILFELGESFFHANEWQLAIDWFTKLLAVDPNNTHARTDIGTANFNLGRLEEAKEAWLGVLEIDPNDVQAHYNMGFFYASVEPVDLAAARQEWAKVVELAPGSTLAETAQQHLRGLPEETTPAATPEMTPGEGSATGS